MFDKASLSEQVEFALRREITEGRIRPGERVSVADYQEAWNISSTPFRDAIRALETQGFVAVAPRRGVYVAPMDLATVKEIFDLRIALEGMAVELATSLIPHERAQDVLDTYRHARALLLKGDPSALSSTDMLVHDLVREHCGNRRLQRLLASQMDLFRWAQNAIISKMPSSYEVALPEHIAIMSAICDQDTVRAVQAMRTHLQNSRERLIAQVAQQEPSPGKASG